VGYDPPNPSIGVLMRNFRKQRRGPSDPAAAASRLRGMPRADLDAEVIAEEDGGPAPKEPRRPLPLRYEQPSAPGLREVRTAALAAAGGALAGVATVAAVRAVSGSATRRRNALRPTRRSDRPPKVVASRSFLIDVHLLGK
jgi:hypothetical protein